MEFIRKSHRKFQYSVHPAIVCRDEGVSITGGVAYFDNREFEGKKECESWFKAFAEGTMKLNQTESIQKALHGVKAASARASDQEWEIIKSLMTDPEEFTADDVAVYHPILAHNVVDRDRERFVKDLLNNFAETLPDKPLLIGHSGTD